MSTKSFSDTLQVRVGVHEVQDTRCSRMECPCNGHVYRGVHGWGEENCGFPDTIGVAGAVSRLGVESHVKSKERKKSEEK
jgi:hypothetical protein